MRFSTNYVLIFSLFCFLPLTNAEEPTRVYILAGQSNMEGKGSVETLNHQLKDPEKAKLFAPIVDGDRRLMIACSAPGAIGRRSTP